MGVPNPEELQSVRPKVPDLCKPCADRVRFGVFELRTETRELLKAGIRIHLQSKPFQILETLVSRPGELITRDELQRKLWSSGTFVDFESGLNTAINRLRAALSDSADEPRFIETLPRLGYRFVCPVDYDTPDPAPEQQPVELPVNLAPAILLPPVKAPNRAPWWVVGASLVTCAVLVVLLEWISRRPAALDFRPVTFRGGAILSARFLTPSRVIYSLSKNELRQAFVSDVNGTNSQLVPGVDALSISPYGADLAALSLVSVNPPGHPMLRLSRLDWQGHHRAVLAEGISAADWSPNGKHLAIVRYDGAESQLESPPGRVLYRSECWLNDLRLSPDGSEIAFLEHPTHDDDAGRVRVVSASGSTHALTPEWASADGLAWNSSGREIWFTASAGGLTRSLYSVTIDGRMRRLSQQPLSLRLLDVSNDGRALLSVDDLRMLLRIAVDGKEAEVSPFDFSHVEDLSRDGHRLLFTESGDAGGPHYSAYIYDFCNKQVRRFGPGRALALSPDRLRAVTMDPRDRGSLTVTTLSSGVAVKVSGSGFRYQWAKFRNDSELLVGGSFPGGPLVLGLQEIASGNIVPVAGVPYLSSVAVSPDGNRFAGRVKHAVEIVDLKPKPKSAVVAGLADDPLAWSADGKSLFLLAADTAGYSILSYDLATARTTTWKTIDNQRSLAQLAGIAVAPEAGVYAWSSHIELSRLYLVGNLGSGS